MLKKILLSALLILSLTSVSFADAGDIGIIQSATTAGGGGFRYDFGGGWVGDLAIALTSSDAAGTAYRGWADLYYGSYGIMLTYSDSGISDYDFVFAAEKNITDDIILGLYTNLVGYNKTAEQLQFFTVFDAYIVLSL